MGQHDLPPTIVPRVLRVQLRGFEDLHICLCPGGEEVRIPDPEDSQSFAVLAFDFGDEVGELYDPLVHHKFRRPRHTLLEEISSIRHCRLG